MDDVFETIQALATAIFSVATAASVAYETGYFSIVGYKYQGLLSLSDYASSALEWLPWLVMLYAAGFLMARAGSSESIKKFISFRIRGRIPYALSLLVLLLVTVSLLFVPFYWVLLCAPIAVLPLVGALLFVPPGRQNTNLPTVTVMATSSTIVLIALFCSGVGQAHRDIVTIENAYIVRASEARGVQILRTLGKGLLIWEPADSKVDFVRWEKVDRLTHLIWKSADAPWMDTLGCKISEWFCYHKQAPTP